MPDAIAGAGLLPGDGEGPLRPPFTGHQRDDSPDGGLSEVAIMIVEDDATNARLLAAVLKSEGADVRVVRDAQEALTALSESKPRLVILDLILPRMSGLMLAKQLKADPATRDIVLIAVSGITGPQTERLAIESGCAAYLAKPIDIDALLTTLRLHLGDSHERR